MIILNPRFKTHPMTTELHDRLTGKTALLLSLLILCFGSGIANAQVVPVITGQIPNPLTTPEETALPITLGNLVVFDPDSTYPNDFTLSVQDGTNYTRVGNTITPALDFNGNLSVPVTVNDGVADGTNVDSAPFNLTVAVTAENDQPQITGQNVVTTPEDTPREILVTDLIITDPDNNYPADFTLSVQNGPGYSRVGNTITPPAGFNGDLAVRVRVADNSGAGNAQSAQVEITVTVTPVDNVPVIIGGGPLSTPEETALTITLADLTVTDPDSNYPADFTLSVQAGANYTVAGSTITPALDFNGNLSVPVIVNDGTSNSAPFNLTVSVTAVNDQPVITGQIAVTTPEVTARTILLTDLLVTDADNNYPADFTLTVSDGSNYTRVGNTITPAADFNGDLNVPVSVRDNSGEGNATSSPFNLIVTVTEVNNQPVITGQVPLTTVEDTALTILLANLTVTDADNVYPTDFTLTVLPGTNYSVAGPTITPALDYNGDLGVQVRVNDGETDSAVFNLVVSVTPVNDQPLIAGQLVLSTPEDTSITIVVGDIIITDPDSANFTLTLQPGINYTVAGNAVTPAENFSGNLIVAATVTDDSGEVNATSLSANLTIEVTAVNDLPAILIPIEDQLAVEGTPFNLDISPNFADADGDTLFFDIGTSELPASGNISFDGTTGVFSGTPTEADARDSDPYIINVTATDNKDGTIPAAALFNLNISALARANVSLGIGVTPDPAMLNDPLRWTFTVRNAAGLQSATSVELNGSFIGSGLTVTSAAACTIQAPAGQVTNFSCTVGGLPPGGSTSLVLNTATSEIGDVTAFAIAAGTLPVPIDPNIDDNSAQLAVGVAQSFSNGAVQGLGNTNVLSVAAGDVNGDGAADLVVGTAAGQPVQIYLSGGFRDFVTSPISLADTGANEGVALADFDGNGTLDLVVANGGGQADMVYSNDGAANFSAMATLDASFSQDVGVGDFNNDGDMDIIIAAVQGNPVYRGNGNGGFTLQGTLGTANSQAVAVGRFDGDSNDDVAFANLGSSSRVWVFNDSGNWFASRALLAIGDAVSVTTGEFGGDGRDDLVFARVPAAIGDVPANPVLINNGDGTFGAPASLLGAAPTSDIHAGDVNNVDGAGLDDLVFINSSGVHQIWVANGSGGFGLHSEQIADRNSFAGVLTDLGMTDVGDPGGVDLAMGGAIQSGVGVFLNDGFGNLGRGDAVPPVLTLRGDVVVDVPAGTVYSDAGATAEDNIDGDLSSSVVTVGSVNSSIVGAYTLTYNVTDFAGNPATPITRIVNIAAAAGRGGGGGALSAYSILLLVTSLMAAQYIRVRRCRLRVRTNVSPRKDS